MRCRASRHNWRQGGRSTLQRCPCLRRYASPTRMAPDPSCSLKPHPTAALPQVLTHPRSTRLRGVWAELQVRRDDADDGRHRQQVLGQEGRQAAHHRDGHRVDSQLLLRASSAQRQETSHRYREDSDAGVHGRHRKETEGCARHTAACRRAPLSGPGSRPTCASRSAVAMSSASPTSLLPPGQQTSPAGRS